VSLLLFFISPDICGGGSVYKLFVQGMLIFKVPSNPYYSMIL